MVHSFPELVVGGVLVAPFVAYAGAALVVLLLLIPVLRAVGFEALFSNPPAALLCLYVTILAAEIVLF